MSLLTRIRQKSILLNKSFPKKIALPEFNIDPRVQKASITVTDQEICQPILFGSVDECYGILKSQKTSSTKSSVYHIADPSKMTDILGNAFYEQRRHKFPEWTSATSAINYLLENHEKFSNIDYANLLASRHHVDGVVAGSIATSSLVAKSALVYVGPKGKTVSSFFIMEKENQLYFYSDCAFVIDPNPEQLKDIAIDTSLSFKQLVSDEPKVALLSFSTNGSVKDHPHVNKIRSAKSLIEEESDIIVEGECQLDAAIIPKVSESKFPDSKIKGGANVLIFPDLNSGNIGYKLTQRLGGFNAIGPIFQGLKAPSNDLSRGCSSDDIVDVCSVTVCQSEGSISNEVKFEEIEV